MKKSKLVKTFAFGVVKKLALSSATKNANAACVWYNHQPTLPQEVKNLRKF